MIGARCFSNKVDDNVVLTWLRGEGIDAGGVQYGWRKSV